MNRRRFLATPMLVIASAAAAADAYPPVTPGQALRFPRDFGSHPAYRSEWWYITGWVRDAAGRPFGIQVTFFRNRPRIGEDNPSSFAPRELLFAHAAIADARLGKLRHDQRAARAGFGLAGAAEETTRAWIGDWSLELANGAYRARIAARDFAFELRFVPTQGVLLQGDAGFSRKGPAAANASFYYSQPQLTVSGDIAIGSERVAVTGTAWLDHEWSSEAMPAGASGWDWVGINLDGGGALMAFRMRGRGGGTLWAGGSRRAADGSLVAFAPGEIRFTARRDWRSPRTGIEYPVAMTVRAGEIEYSLEPLLDDQELDSRASTATIYWEGAVRALRAGQEVGRGYLELTGYGAPLKL